MERGQHVQVGRGRGRREGRGLAGEGSGRGVQGMLVEGGVCLNEGWRAHGLWRADLPAVGYAGRRSAGC